MRRLATAVALVLLVSACGNQSAQDAKARLRAAFERLSNSPGTTLTFTIQSTPESLQALANDGGDDLSRAVVDKILSSSVTISSNGAVDPQDSAGEMTLSISGDDLIEMRWTGLTFYVRAAVRELVRTFGGDQASVDQFVEEAGQYGWDFARPLVEGEWISLTGFEQFMNQMPGLSQVNPANQKAFGRFLDKVEEDASVTSAGREAAGEHLVATASVRDVYRDFVELAQSSGQQFPPGAFPSEGDVPDKSIRFDLWVDGGELTQVEFDFLQLRQFADEDWPDGVNRMALRVSVAPFDGKVATPPDAVQVDVASLLQGMMGGALGGSSSGSGSATAPPPHFCDQLKGQPRSVLKQWAQECPQLLK